MDLVVLDTHTVAENLLTPGGWAIDVGCRGFVFARELVARGLNVICLDPDPAIEDPNVEGVTFLNKALVASPESEMFYASWSTGEGNFVTTESAKIPHYAKASKVQCVTLENLMREYGVDVFDVVKMDCEGSEYEILSNWSGPVAKQISVEYHDFTEHVGDDLADCHKRIDDVLSRWYATVQHEYTHHLGDPTRVQNYWDSVYVLKELTE